MKNTSKKRDLSPDQRNKLLSTLKSRFEKNMDRHQGLDWSKVEAKLRAHAEKLWTLNEMEQTGGEPDVVGFDKKSGEFIFYDCAPETPKGRRSLCYDRAALNARKEHKPADSATDVAATMGVEVMSEEDYREVQSLGQFDQKTSRWLKTPADIRKRGGAIFGDFRYGRVFIYHNGAESYYAARAFRAALKV